MTIIPFSDALQPAWDAFCDASPEAWWFHRSEWLAYCVVYRPGAVNRSFAVVDDAGAILAICPLIQEGNQFTMGGEPGAAPIRCGWSFTIATAIDLLAEQHAIQRVAFRSAPLALQPIYFPGPWERDDCADIGWSTRLLDLIQPKSALWRGVRKGHRADVRKAEKTATFLFPDPEKIQGRTPTGLTDIYAGLHRAVHGNPRSMATYALQGTWARLGYGFPIVMLQEIITAVAYFLIYKQTAYWMSGASLIPDVMVAVIWHAILALKARGVTTLELGWQGKAIDAKGKNVERFKRGLGGYDRPIFAVERNYP